MNHLLNKNLNSNTNNTKGDRLSRVTSTKGKLMTTLTQVILPTADYDAASDDRLWRNTRMKGSVNTIIRAGSMGETKSENKSQ